MKEVHPELLGLPDILVPGLTLVFVGYNPSLPAARTGHYYAGKQNHFYQLLYRHGLTLLLLTPEQDQSLPHYGIGLTDLCPIPSAQATHLPRGTLSAGKEALLEKLERFGPEIVCLNGLGVFQVIYGRRAANIGLQHERIGASQVYVVPSTSPANNGLMAEREAAFAGLAKLAGEASAPGSRHRK